MNRLLELLLLAFPRGFRREFGPGMLELMLLDYVRARASGRRRAAAFVAATAVDVIIAGIGERLNPTWVASGHWNDGRWEMATTLDTWTKDLLHAARSLLRASGFSVVTVATLTLAIGANTAIFSVFDAVLLDPLPFPAADRIVSISATAPGSDFPEEFGVSAEFYFQYRDGAALLEEVTLFQSIGSTMRGADWSERLRMAVATPDFYRTLGVTPVLGRLPVAEEEDGAVVISHAFWVTRFGADPSILGRSYDIAGATRTVVGVMGPELRLPEEETAVWIPELIEPADVTPGRFGWSLMGRMVSGTEHADLEAQLAALAQRLPERFGGSANYARLIGQHRPVVRSLEEELFGDVSGPLWVLLGTVGIVLLIACANVANLFMVRAETRRRDLAVRRALGAGRARLVRSQMSEALLLAGLGGVGGSLLAWIGVPVLVRVAPAGIPRLDAVGLDPNALLFTAGISILAAVAFGLAPAIRFSAPGLVGGLRQAGSVGRGGRNVSRHALVVVQTASALVLLVASGLLIRSFVALRGVDPGYDTEDIFTFQFAPEGGDLSDGPSYARFHFSFAERLAAIPGVESVGLVENLPLDEQTAGTRFATDENDDVGDGGTFMRYTYAAEDYFQTMGIELLAGRHFERDDHAEGDTRAILSRSAAELLWPGEDPIGNLFRMVLDESGAWVTVIGLVEDVRQNDFRRGADPLIYYPIVGPTPRSWAIVSPAYVVRSARADLLAPEVRSLLREMAPGAPMYRVFTMEALAARSMEQLTFITLTLALASGLALMLGAVGLYGVLSYLVTQRTREIGVRMALGAKAREVRRMVVLQGGRVTLFGVAIGVALALGLTRVLETLLFGVEALDLATFLGMSGVMLAVALLASYLPARRASSVDPMQSLRSE